MSDLGIFNTKLYYYKIGKRQDFSCDESLSKGSSMANDNPQAQDKRPIQKEQTKKPYTKPAFRFERVFVTRR